MKQRNTFKLKNSQQTHLQSSFQWWELWVRIKEVVWSSWSCRFRLLDLKLITCLSESPFFSFAKWDRRYLRYSFCKAIIKIR